MLEMTRIVRVVAILQALDLASAAGYRAGELIKLLKKWAGGIVFPSVLHLVPGIRPPVTMLIDRPG